MNYWKLATWVLLLLLGCAILLGAHWQAEPTTKRVEAEEFILKDSTGHIRARIGMKDDKPQIEFYNENGNSVAKLPNYGFTPLDIR